MFDRNPPDGPAIRPLSPDGPEPPERSAGKLLALITGLAGVAIGFFLAGIASQTTSTTTTLTDLGTPTTQIHALTATTNTTPTTPPPTAATTTSAPPTTRGPIAAPPTLGEMVPDFEGVLRFTLGARDLQMGRWASLSDAPTLVDLPAGAQGARWDASGRWVASTTLSAFGDALYLGTPSLLRPAYIGAGGFGWHDTTEGQIAFFESLGTDDEGGETYRIYLGEVTNIGLAFEEWATLETPFAFGAGITWGDWGMALTGRSPNGLLSVLTLDPDGNVLTEFESSIIIDNHPDGTLLLAQSFAEPDPDTGLWFELLLSDPAGADVRAAPWTIASSGMFSNNGLLFVSTDIGEQGTSIWFDGDDIRFEVRSAARDPIVLGWTPDDRFAVLWTSFVRHRNGSGPALLFVDIIDRSANAVPVDGVVNSLAFER